MQIRQTISQQIARIKKASLEVISEKELAARLETSISEGKPLRVKAGFDPTSSDIHLGHTVLLNKLRLFQEMGHVVYFIVGDFTAKIGDPSGRNELRPLLSDDQIKENAKTYTDQAFQILDRNKTEVIFNSVWYKDLTLGDFLPLLRSYTIAQILERDDFSERLQNNLPLTLLELIYPLIQGFDSVKVKADIEIGGSDQKFNLIVGRRIQEYFGMKPQVVMTLPLLVGLDGVQKMSKSLNNYIGVSEPPKEIFGKVMSISDELMYDYFSKLTELEVEHVKAMHPKDAKLLLAETLVGRLYSPEKGHTERERFTQLFSKRELTDDVLEPMHVIQGSSLSTALLERGVVSSKNELRRLLQQKAVSFNDEKIESENFIFINPGILKVGKKKFFRIVLQEK